MATERQIREAMSAFIEQRLADKLENEKDEGKRQRLREQYHPSTWIADAAHYFESAGYQITRIRLATHVIKFSHPDAQGSSILSKGCETAGDALVGTHTLGNNRPLDVIGNAAELPKGNFLRQEVEEVPLWQMMRDQHQALFAALPGSAEENHAWIEAFAMFAKEDPKPSSSQLVKQVYWHLGNNDYHLLQPLFPTSLVQRTYDILREAQFSEEKKAAREAKRSGKPHACGYRDWPDLLVQKFGGTKPQNISQLNSERRGEAWLLPSLPPSWKQAGLRPPLHVRTVFKRLPNRFDLKAGELGRYLASVGDRNNKGIRDGRVRRVSEVIDDLIHFGCSFGDQLPAGWSADEDCKLDDVERYWLDPNRDDEDFQRQRNFIDWPREVADRFGKWLNSRLHKRHRLPVGDREHHEWLSEFENELADHLREIKNV